MFSSVCQAMSTVCLLRILGLLSLTWWLQCVSSGSQDVNRVCRVLVRLEPLVGIYCDLVRYYVAVSLGAHRSTGKLLSVLAGIFTELALKVCNKNNLV